MPSLSTIGLVALASVGLGFLLVSTVRGLGISPDSTRYVAAARNLAQGRGIQVLGPDAELEPLTLWAPLYPAVLAVPTRLGLDALPAARYLNALLFAANILLIGLIARRLPGSSALVTLLAAAAFLIAPEIVAIHGWLWTEPLTLLAGFLGLYTLDRGLVRGSWWLFLVAGSLFAVASLLRYAGLAFAFAGAVGVLLIPGKTAGRGRWQRVALLLAMSFVPILAWTGYTSGGAGNSIGRTLFFRLSDLDGLGRALPVVGDWLLPGRVAEPIRLWAGGLFLAAWAVIGVGLLARRLVRHDREEAREVTYLPELLVLFVFAYACMLALTKLLFVPPGPVSGRILTLPFYAILVVSLTLLGQWMDRLTTRVHAAPRWHWVRLPLAGVVAVVTILWMGFNLVHTVKWGLDAREEGMGYAATSWTESSLIAYLRQLPESARIYTNGPDAVYILTGRVSKLLPSRETARAATIDDLSPPVAEMQMELAGTNGVIAFFRGITWRDTISEVRLKRLLLLRPLIGTEAGSIYAVGE